MPAETHYTFTVFTPTYNRAHTLARVYESLARQSFRDFEWLIVDDGSTDGTAELVASWQAAAGFPIRYVQQENQGKHFAFNRGVAEARGELFLTLDSDDACVPEALERLHRHWTGIPRAERERFSAVTCLCIDQNGNVVGDRFPADVTDSDSLEIAYRYRVRGEKWGFQRTDVLRRFPLPEVLPREYVPEVLAWSPIARRYRTRFVNEALRIYYVDRPSMVTGQPAGKFAAGRRLAHRHALNADLDYLRYAPLDFFRAAGQYARLSLHAGVGPAQQLDELDGAAARLLWAVMLPVAWLIYRLDVRR
jgi:glycosyltransferase involved in cell wall biosynthesis